MNDDFNFSYKILFFFKKNTFFLNLLLSFFGGLFFAFGFAPFNYTFCSFLGLFFLYFLAITNFKYKKLFLYSLIFISSYALFSLRWIFFAPLNIEHLKFLAPFALCAMILYLEFYFFIFVFLFSSVSQKLKKILNHKFKKFAFFFRPIFFASLFIFFFEFLRSKGSFAFPWNLFGTIFLDFSFSVKLIQKFGIFWFGFFMLLIFGIIFEIFLAFFAKKYQKIFLCFLSLFLVLFFLLICNLESKKNQCLSESSPEVSKKILLKKPYIGIRIISTSIDQKIKWHQSFLNKNLIENAALSFKKNSNDITYFVWPETSFSFAVHLNESGELIKNQNIDYLSSFLKKGQFLIFGTILKQKISSNEDLIFNSVVMIDSEGKIISFYNKKKLAPFGEFLPFGDFLNFFNLEFLKPFNSIKKGSDNQSYIQCLENDKFLRKFYPLICFEAIFPFNKFQKKIAKESDLILNFSNDAWFDKKLATSQHLRMTRVRAIEASKPLIRIVNGGFSGLIDKNGKILQISNPEKASCLDLYVK